VGKKWLKEEVNLGAEGGRKPLRRPCVCRCVCVCAGLDEREKNGILAAPEIPATLMIKSVYYHKNLVIYSSLHDRDSRALQILYSLFFYFRIE